MASSRLTRRRQGSVPKSDSPDNDGENVVVVGNAKNNNVAKRSNDFRIEDLEMVKTIGTGTFARVYLCRHRRTDYYALKVWIVIKKCWLTIVLKRNEGEVDIAILGFVIS